MAYIVFGTISAVVGIGGLVFGFVAYSRNKKTDDNAEGQKGGIMLTEIGYIKAGIDDMKRDIREFRGEIQTLNDKYARLDESVKTAHRRIDKLEKYHTPH
jgi:predicted  nucleic acid-binding Zn-ribbon protein